MENIHRGEWFVNRKVQLIGMHALFSYPKLLFADGLHLGLAENGII